jgi:hypothetical protein
LEEAANHLIWYYKTVKSGLTNPKEISIHEGEKMLMDSLKDALEILGLGSTVAKTYFIRLFYTIRLKRFSIAFADRSKGMQMAIIVLLRKSI